MSIFANDVIHKHAGKVISPLMESHLMENLVEVLFRTFAIRCYVLSNNYT